MKINKTIITTVWTLMIAAFSLLLTGCGKSNATSAGNTWTANLNVSQTGSVTVGSAAYYSSTKLYVTWTSPSQTVDHYTLAATDSVQSTQVSAAATSSSINATLTGLKSATTYTVSITACLDASCSEKLTGSTSASAATPQEVWQIQGTGDSFSAVTKPVTDGNTMPYAVRFGSGAGSSLEGKLQLYYNPSGQSEKGAKIAILPSAATSSVSSVSSFTSLSGVGLINPSSAAPLAGTTTATQAVPLNAALGSKLRLFIESQGSDGRTRVLYLDSQDGYTGQDFNSGSSTQCSTQADYSTGGGCAPTPVIGVEGDATAANTNISDARQFKVGYPILTDWRWDGAAGTFMVFTVDTVTSCTTANRMQGYAVYDGSSKWNVQYATSTCPKMFQNMQAPMPVHLGGAKYKMYYSDTTNQSAGTGLPAPGPKKIIYADASVSGNASYVDYEDWEAIASARDVTFLWPSGADFGSANENYLDDYVMLSATGDLSLQVMYTNMTDGSAPPFTGMTVLMNP